MRRGGRHLLSSGSHSPAFAQRVGLGFEGGTAHGPGRRVYQAPPVPTWNPRPHRSCVSVGLDPRKRGQPA